jgi:hypothetical protein
MTRPRLALVSRDLAYGVPWSFAPAAARPLYALTNIGTEVLSDVTVTVTAAAAPRSSPAVTLRPTESLQIRLDEVDAAGGPPPIVRWSRPNGDEYLWRARR